MCNVDRWNISWCTAPVTEVGFAVYKEPLILSKYCEASSMVGKKSVNLRLKIASNVWIFVGIFRVMRNKNRQEWAEAMHEGVSG